MTRRISTALLAIAALACGRPGYAPPDGEPTIEGEVTAVTPSAEEPEAGPTASALGTVLIEEVPGQLSGGAKMALTVTTETQLLRWNADAAGWGTVELGDIAVGMPVRAWVTGPIAESYPSQARAHTIVVPE